jgi:hypothetical protein
MSNFIDTFTRLLQTRFSYKINIGFEFQKGEIYRKKKRMLWNHDLRHLNPGVLQKLVTKVTHLKEM